MKKGAIDRVRWCTRANHQPRDRFERGEERQFLRRRHSSKSVMRARLHARSGLICSGALNCRQHETKRGHCPSQWDLLAAMS